MDEILIIAICLTLNALLAAYEMAFVSIPRPELRGLAKSGNAAAQRLVKLRESPERTLSVIQVGITLVGAIAAAIGGAGAAENLEPYFMQKFGLREFGAEILSVILVVIPITYLSVVVGELVPKTLALRNPGRIVLAGSRFLFIADRLLSPVITVLEWSTRKILQTFFSSSKFKAAATAVEAIEIDSLSPLHQRFMLNLADIEKKLVKDIMLPWSQVNFVHGYDSIDRVAQVALQSGHTRLPVLDKDRIIGILHTKEFMALRDSGETIWQSIVRLPLKARAGDSALRLLRTMQEKRSHMVIVVDEANAPLGIVTLEDIIEEVVGEIYDEDDDGRIRKVYASRARGSRL